MCGASGWRSCTRAASWWISRRRYVLEHGDALALEDGRLVEVVAAEEELLEITGHSAAELSQLAWHIGNRHLAAQIEQFRILILRDGVIRDMLLGLGAHVRDVVEPFHPVRGAYSGAARARP